MTEAIKTQQQEQSKPSPSMEEQLSKAVKELSNTVESLLDVEQKAALESKFNTLAPEIRSATSTKYPMLSVVGCYIIRQMVKEANGKMASEKRPGWYLTLKSHARTLRSGDEAVRNWSKKTLEELAEQIDSKESTTLLKKYKNETDQTTESAEIKQLAGIFGVSPATLK